MAERAIYIIHRDRDKGVQLGLIWMDSMDSEKQRLTRLLRPEFVYDAHRHMVLRYYMTEEEVINILKRHGFVESTRDMVEVSSGDKMVTKMVKL